MIFKVIIFKLVSFINSFMYCESCVLGKLEKEYVQDQKSLITKHITNTSQNPGLPIFCWQPFFRVSF